MDEPSSWRQGAVIYQIYPRSFYDAKGTGVGNLRGIIEKLDYLGGRADSLGVNAIWISPIYPSPMADFGYDVSNYTDVDPLFGTLDDLKELVRESHARNMKVILDFVPNHSSDEHPWFKEAAASRDDMKRDWYIWRDPGQDGGPPNNWLSVFGGSAWQYSEMTKQYYLHSFLAKQPDLNWDNPAVRDAMKAAMRFWLDLGVDGFRVDAVDWLSKDAEFRNDEPRDDLLVDIGPGDYRTLRHSFSREGPQLFDRLNEMTGVLQEYDDRFMITEAHPETDDKIQGYLEYYQSVNSQVSAPFNFQGIYLPWDAATFRKFIDDFQAVMQPSYTPVYAIGNHDEPRIATRIGEPAARTAAMMLLTLPGMAFIYNGEELGMTDGFISDEQRLDPGSNRDPQRTPLQWDDSPYAGFSTETPWLPLPTDYSKVNVAIESQDAASSLTLYKRLIELRNHSAVLKTGTYLSLESSAAVFCYERQLGDKTLLITLNFSSEEQIAPLRHIKGKILLSTHLDQSAATVGDQILLRPHEGLIIEILDD